MIGQSLNKRDRIITSFVMGVAGVITVGSMTYGISRNIELATYKDITREAKLELAECQRQRQAAEDKVNDYAKIAQQESLRAKKLLDKTLELHKKDSKK